MASDNGLKNLLIIGVHLKSEGYPNTLYRLHDLQTSGLFNVTEIYVPIWHEGTQNRHGVGRLTRNLCRAIFAHITVIVRYLACKRPKLIYVPYPAVFVIFLLSWLPQRLRPNCIIADAFISIYDTVVFDRSLINENGLPARILKWIEKRAYAYTDKLVVDTPQNARFFCKLFGLTEEKVVVIPLSTNEIDFKYTPYSPKSSYSQVLFVGTLVPLHGIQTILDAIRLVSKRSDIHFKLVGNGQDAHIIEAWLKTYSLPIVWEKEWLPSNRIAEEIGLADICLGVFGLGNKTQRVCPFKIYAYASMGKAIITGETDWLKNTTDGLSYEPFLSVPTGNAEALAEKIILLADNPELRASMAANSHEYYLSHLNNHFALKKLVSYMLEC